MKEKTGKLDVALLVVRDGWGQRQRELSVDVREMRVGTDTRERDVLGYVEYGQKDTRKKERFVRVSVNGHHNAFLTKAEVDALIAALKKAKAAL